MERQCLRWWMTARPCIHPLHNQKKLQKFYIYADVSHTHTPTNQSGKVAAATERLGGGVLQHSAIVDDDLRIAN